MLGKLIGHEFKITARYFIPMYICLGVVTLLLKLSWFFTVDNDVIFMGSADSFLNLVNVLLITVYVIVIIAIFLLTYFIILRRFYTNMFSDEGYLMFTLPVTTKQLINSKLIVAFIWQFLMVPAMCLSFFILFVNTDILRELPYAWNALMKEIHILNISGFQIWLIIGEFAVVFLTEMLLFILLCYLSMTIGQQFLTEHRLLGSVLAFLAIYTIESLITSLVTMVTGNISVELMTFQDFSRYFNTVLPLAILTDLIYIIIYYVIVHHLLDKKLNLN